MESKAKSRSFNIYRLNYSKYGIRAFLMQPCTRVIRARCARSAMVNGNSCPRPLPRQPLCVLHKRAHLSRARTASFHYFWLSLYRLPLSIWRLPLSFCRLPVSFCRPSHSAGFLCVLLSLCDFLGRTSSLGLRTGLRLFSSFSLSSFKLQ